MRNSSSWQDLKTIPKQVKVTLKLEVGIEHQVGMKYPRSGIMKRFLSQ